MPHVKHAIISAAGLGSRLGLNMPKCLVEIGGKPLIEHQLELLSDVEDVRIVVGFMEHDVINAVLKVRRDVVFVRNPHYRTTTNSYSVCLASRDLKQPFVIVDGDLLLEKTSFLSFLKQCHGEKPIVGITQAKTEEAVFVRLNPKDGILEGFQRTPILDYEWSGIAYINGFQINEHGKYVYHEIEKHLPLPYAVIDCYEIDTPDDMEKAISFYNSTV